MRRISLAGALGKFESGPLLKGELFKLINPTEAIGLELTETFAMNPAAAVSGFSLAPPEAHYFAVSKIAEDQTKDWATRAGFSEAEAKRWLAPIL